MSRPAALAAHPTEADVEQNASAQPGVLQEGGPQSEEALSTMDVVDLSGATYRQIDYWARQGVLYPAIGANGSGSHRRYTPLQAAVAAALVRLSKMGMHGRVLARVGRELCAGPRSGVIFVDEDGNVSDKPGRTGWLLDLDAL